MAYTLRQLVWMVEGAWNHTAWICAMLEMAHSSERVIFNSDKWHPMKEAVDNLPPMSRRRLMHEQVKRMPKTFGEFKEQMRKGKR